MLKMSPQIGNTTAVLIKRHELQTVIEAGDHNV